MKNFKWLILGIFIICECILYFYQNQLTNPILKFIPSFVLFLTYFFNRKKILTNKDKLFLISLLLSLIGEIFFLYNQDATIKIVLILVYLIEHQFYISIYREENAEILKVGEENNFLKITPYLILSFLFFGILLMPSVPDKYFLLVLLYSFQMALLGAMSALRKVNKVSYFLMLVAFGLLFISDGLTSIRFFLGEFLLDVVVIRFFYFGSKLFFAESLLASYQKT